MRLGCGLHHVRVDWKVERLESVDIGREQDDGGDRSIGDRSVCIRDYRFDSREDSV